MGNEGSGSQGAPPRPTPRRARHLYDSTARVALDFNSPLQVQFRAPSSAKLIVPLQPPCRCNLVRPARAHKPPTPWPVQNGPQAQKSARQKLLALKGRKGSCNAQLRSKRLPCLCQPPLWKTRKHSLVASSRGFSRDASREVRLSLLASPPCLALGGSTRLLRC
jgi:hypothetical protein